MEFCSEAVRTAFAAVKQAIVVKNFFICFCFAEYIRELVSETFIQSDLCSGRACPVIIFALQCSACS